MQNVAPSRRLQRRSRAFLFASALVFLLGAALAVVGIGLHVFSLVVPVNPGYEAYDLTRKGLLLVGFGITGIAMLMALRAISWKTDNALAWRLGELLAQELDRRYVFIRNISQPSLGAIDAAIVSRHGVLALRVCGRKGEYFNEGGDWLRRGRNGGWRSLRWNPTRDVVNDAIKLKALLKDYQLAAAPVFTAVVFMRAPHEAQFKLREPAVPVVYAGQLIRDLQDSYFAQDRLNARAAQQIVNLLYH